MSDEKKGGWNIGDPDKMIAEYNEQAFLTDFPPEARWSQVQGLLFRIEPSRNPDNLVSIQALDHKSELTRVWMSEQNALYLMHLLQQWAHSLGSPPQTEMAAPTAEHS